MGNVVEGKRTQASGGRVPRGVPAVRSWPGPAKPGLALGLGLLAAGVTGAASFAADRLSRQRRIAAKLDDDLGERRYFSDDPDEQFMATAPDGVGLFTEIDYPRPQSGSGEDKPTVVLSHGYCLSSQCWVFQRRALRRAGYRVVLWDQRGHGRSGSGDPESYCVDTLGADLAAVIAAAAPSGPLVLAGHSMGGMTMMSYALAFPQEVSARVAGAAFIATSAGDLGGVEYGLGRVAGGIVHKAAPGIARLLAGAPQVVDQAVRAGRDLVDFAVDWGSFGSPVPMSVARLTTDMIFGTDLEVAAEFLPRFDAHDKRAALGAFNGREVLVFNGTRDRLTPAAHSDEIVRHLPGAEHVVVEGAGHVIMLEVPDLLNAALLELLDRAGRGGTDSPGSPGSPGGPGNPGRPRPGAAWQDIDHVREAFKNQWR